MIGCTAVYGLPLSQLEVLVIDCQATAAAPRGHLLEIAWARSVPCSRVASCSPSRVSIGYAS